MGGLVGGVFEASIKKMAALKYTLLLLHSGPGHGGDN